MNNNYCENLDKNFLCAIQLCEKTHSHSEIIDMLKTGNIPQKQFASLYLQEIQSEEDANILLSNLTGQDGKIREAVSLKLKEFLENEKYLKYFNNPKNTNIFIDALTDINGNICRNIISAVTNLKYDNDFCTIFCGKLAQLSLELLNIVEKFDFQDGKYKVNKEAFKLYWCLECIYQFSDKIPFNLLKEILLRSKNIEEYTIREKTAKILTKISNDSELLQAKKELKCDKNYYVRRF